MHNIQPDPQFKNTTKKKNSIKKKIIIIVSLVIALLLIIGLTVAILVYIRLKSIHDPSVTISERSGEYSAPIDYSGDDFSKAESNSGGDWENSEPINEESNSNTSENTSGNNSGGGGGGGNWVWSPKKVPIIKKAPIDSNIVNILILGVDSSDAIKSGGRTDTMIVASLNKKTGEINLISMLRDSFVPIEDFGWNRLNTGYFFGGVGLCINTINDVFLLDIQSYVMVDFVSLPKLVDKIGGIEVELTKVEADYYNKNYAWGVSPGTVLLNGEKALKHARNRSVGNADFARTSRQRDLLERIIKKILDKNDLAATVTMLNSSLDLIKTNIEPSGLISLATTVYTGASTSIKTMRMPIDGSYEAYWYRKNMLVTKIDIQKNREAIRNAIYGS